MSDATTPAVETRPIASPTEEQFAEFGKQVAAVLGTSRDWDDATFNHLQQLFGAITIGGARDDDRGRLEFWQNLADKVGIDYDDYDPNADDEDEEYAKW